MDLRRGDSRVHAQGCSGARLNFKNRLVLLAKYWNMQQRISCHFSLRYFRSVSYNVNRIRGEFPSLDSGAAHFDGPGGSQVPQSKT